MNKLSKTLCIAVLSSLPFFGANNVAPQETNKIQEVKREGVYYPVFYDSYKSHFMCNFKHIYEIIIMPSDNINKLVNAEQWIHPEHQRTSTLIYAVLKAINPKPFDPEATVTPGQKLNFYDFDWDGKPGGREGRLLPDSEIEAIIKHNNSYIKKVK